MIAIIMNNPLWLSYVCSKRERAQNKTVTGAYIFISIPVIYGK